jgi:hypothetical protein
VREKYYWLVAGGWFVLREKYCWLVADKPNEQAACLCTTSTAQGHAKDRITAHQKRGEEKKKRETRASRHLVFHVTTSKS